MAKKAKQGQQKIRKLLKKKGQQNFEVTKKRPTKYFSKADTINLAVSCALSSAQPWANSAQQCAEIRESAWEAVRRSGWKFSILGDWHLHVLPHE